jgi:NAD(P)-dependent dehydrogenase (short-subunit alcohol dehydrogenase family)
MKNKKVIVTGGASGIGLAIVKKFASEGATVYIFDHDSAGDAIAENLRKDGKNVLFQKCDVSNHIEIQDLFDKIEDNIDVLINNAGVSHIGALDKTTDSEFDRVYQVNVKGIFNCSYAAIQKMIKFGGGVILNMASVAAVVGIPDRFAYSMSKGATLSMTLSIARDYVDKGIRCNAISPARIHTPFVDGFLKQHYPGQEKEMFEKLAATQPIGRMGTPEEVASMAYFLCSDEAKFITGGNFPVDGGFIQLKI